MLQLIVGHEAQPTSDRPGAETGLNYPEAVTFIKPRVRSAVLASWSLLTTRYSLLFMP